MLGVVQFQFIEYKHTEMQVEKKYNNDGYITVLDVNKSQKPKIETIMFPIAILLSSSG